MRLNKNVVIIREKESVVIRGIEIKLNDMGYSVLKSSGDELDVALRMEQAECFLVYLSVDVIDNEEQMGNLITYSSLIRESGKRMIFIGEKKMHADLMKKVSTIASYPWLDRPLDLELLAEVISNLEPNDLDTNLQSALNDFDFGDALDLDMDEAQPEVTQKRILIVDDDPSYAKTVKGWLKEKYKVDIVTTGMQTITFLMNTKVDLILLDYEMPVVDGPQVFEMLRTEPEMADIPVIFLTGVGDMESVKRVMALKPKGYVLKTTTREDLLKYLSNHI